MTRLVLTSTDSAGGCLLRAGVADIVIPLGFRLLAIGVALGRAGEDLFGDQAGILADRSFDLRGHVGVGLEERL